MSRAAPGSGQYRETGQSLTEFAQSDPGRRGLHCWTCHLPEREEIEAFVAQNGNQWAVIVRWLQERGHEDASKPKVSSHFYERHHDQA